MSPRLKLPGRTRRATRPVILLGPQRRQPTVDGALADLNVDGPVAVVTAGWEEREDEDQELDRHLSGRTTNLNLYQRADDVFQKDPALLERMRSWRDAVREQQSLYRMRLEHALAAARELLAMADQSPAHAEECESSIQAVRDLDEHHRSRVQAITDEFEAECKYAKREAIAAHRDEIGAALEGCGALLVAGGHVAVLRNRLRMFDLLGLVAPGLPIVAWSAGAMALSKRLVLFHDSPPQGPGNAEVAQSGLAVYDGLVPLPHAKHRLRLDDPLRVQLFARRFGPDLCVAMDPGSRVERTPDGWVGSDGTLRLTQDGTVMPMGGA